jgi:hypothetical protein
MANQYSWKFEKNSIERDKKYSRNLKDKGSNNKCDVMFFFIL